MTFAGEERRAKPLEKPTFFASVTKCASVDQHRRMGRRKKKRYCFSLCVGKSDHSLHRCMAKELGFCYVSFVVFSYENHVSDREKFSKLIETKDKNRKGVGVKS